MNLVVASVHTTKLRERNAFFAAVIALGNVNSLLEHHVYDAKIAGGLLESTIQ